MHFMIMQMSIELSKHPPSLIREVKYTFMALVNGGQS